ncbi:neuropeptides capa receptor-like [Cotesia glomerata]|uniref:neuropeptides capa receptor-like n=1 Tax=Cotesia glomerata TaxID=32391 RepID=UPI001D02148E|nr:neuropeptides capa receptor-like [Cotesia glomerata]
MDDIELETMNLTWDENFIFLMENWTRLKNMSEEEYLEYQLGPKHLSLSVVVPITVVYVIIFIMGIVGNILTCWVILRHQLMQSATNYYLFSLAISDLLLLVLGLPFELSVFWQQYPWELGWGLCKIRAYVSETSSYVSVLTIVAFSMERYLAICHPLHLYAMSGLKRPLRFILAAWILAMIAAIPFAIYTKLNYVEYPPGSGRDSEESAFCAMLLPNMPTFPLYELSCLVFFLIPLLLIMVLYIRMGLRIQSTTLGRSIEGTVHGETKQVQSRKSIIRMLSAVVVTFFICWAPFHAQRLLYVYDSKRLLGAINEWLYFLGGCLYYISTAINPILYNVMSAKYRGAFVETLCCTPSINSPLNREDQSSVKETMVYRCGSIRNSQIARGRKRSMRYHLDNSRDDENNYLQHERFLTNLTVMNNLNDSPGEGKLATVIHASNGRAKCKASEKNILLDETHI